MFNTMLLVWAGGDGPIDRLEKSFIVDTVSQSSSEPCQTTSLTNQIQL